MSPEAARIAIAEACGWKHHDASRENIVEKGGMRLPNYFEARDSVDAWTHADHSGVYTVPPNYLSDLNAMHEAEKKLTPDQLEYFCEFLFNALTAGGRAAFRWPSVVVHSPAAPRAEAFLKTIGKWEESA